MDQEVTVCLAVSFLETNFRTDRCIIQYEKNFHGEQTLIHFPAFENLFLSETAHLHFPREKPAMQTSSQACISEFLKTCPNDEED